MTDPGLVPGLLLCFVLAVVGQAILTMTQHHRSTLGWQSRLFLCAFAIRFFVSLVVYQYGLVNVLGDEDGSGWNVGATLYEKWVIEGIGMLDLPQTWSGA